MDCRLSRCFRSSMNSRRVLFASIDEFCAETRWRAGPRRLSTDAMIWFGSQRDPQRATSVAPTVCDPTSQGIRCAPLEPEQSQLSGYGAPPLWLVNICWLVLADCSTKSALEFGKVSGRGASKNLEMLGFRRGSPLTSKPLRITAALASPGP